jgi:hypothetical protein
VLVGKPFVDTNGTQHPGNWFDVYDADDLVRYGVVAINEAEPAVPGEVIATRNLVVQNGVVNELVTYQPIPVPEKISMLQARVVLERANMLGPIMDYIELANNEVKIFWEYASDIHRNHPMVTEISGALSLTSEQIDDLFRAGSLVS